MARTRTRLELRTALRVRADIVNSQHLTDDNLNEMLNGSIAALHALCVEAGEDDFATSVAISTVAGTPTYTVDLYKVRSVHFTGSSGFKRELPRFTLAELPQLENTSVFPYGEPIAYRMIGGKIRLSPTPQAVYSLTVYGVQPSQDLSGDGSTLDGRDGWEEWVLWDCTAKCNIIEETDPRGAIAEREQVQARILKQMRSLDQAKPHRITDVSGSHYDADPFGRWP